MIGDLRLRDGARIAVIGGGPAGAFFAHFARRWADAQGLDISITIFDGKNFLDRGPRGCNLCAGVISHNLETRLREEGLPLPETRVLSRVEGYRIHVGSQTLRLSCIENHQPPIATVFRGNGPRLSSFPGVVSFDDHLLRDACDRGAEVIPSPVWKIELRPPSSSPPVLYFGDRLAPERREADLVVGAFGVNSFLFREVQKLGFGYRPPATLTTFQAEFRVAGGQSRPGLGSDIHVIVPPSKLIRYMTVIPKGEYATVTVVGRRDATPELVTEALASSNLREILPLGGAHCFCYPRIAVSSSKNPFTDRFVMIGDTSFCRHYKNGIESAFVTARLAAEAVFRRGLDAGSLRQAFVVPARRLIARDNTYGRVLFRLNETLSAVPLLNQAHYSLAGGDAYRPATRRIRRLLWNLFTGSAPYREIFFAALDVRLPAALLRQTTQLLWKKVKWQLAN